MSVTPTFAAAFPAPILAVTEEPEGATQIGVGAVVLMVAIAAFLVWVAYLITSSRRKRRAEETPKNLQPWLSDDELENTRLTRVLRWAAMAAAGLAILLPVYFLDESSRQANAAENFEELDIEEGEQWFVKFECSRCHGLDGGGGASEYIEPRSRLTVEWAAPPLNDIFFRYSEEEVRFWITYGRLGTLMPPAGLEGGGSMTEHEMDQVLEYIHSIQVTQEEAFARVDRAVDQALARIRTGAETVVRAIFEQEAVVADLRDAEMRFAVIEDMPARVEQLLTADETCTEESAALLNTVCDLPGIDSDRDGLSDRAERTLTEDVSPIIDDTVVVRSVVVDLEDNSLSTEFVPNTADYPELYGIELDANDPFSMTSPGGEPVADLTTVERFIGALETAHLNLRVTSERSDSFLEVAVGGLEALRDAAVARAWEVDFDATAAEMTEAWLESEGTAASQITVETAQRAVGLFNAYCARCHTGGYSAGVEFEQVPGSGAWAPALTGGRAVVQFPMLADHIEFIIRGSNLAESYGINGLGRGWMPGFGQVLSEEDIRLIALFERTL